MGLVLLSDATHERLNKAVDLLRKKTKYRATQSVAVELGLELLEAKLNGNR